MKKKATINILSALKLVHTYPSIFYRFCPWTGSRGALEPVPADNGRKARLSPCNLNLFVRGPTHHVLVLPPCKHVDIFKSGSKWLKHEYNLVPHVRYVLKVPELWETLGVRFFYPRLHRYWHYYKWAAFWDFLPQFFMCENMNWRVVSNHALQL